MPPDLPSASRLRRSLKFPIPLKVVPNNLSLIVRRLKTLRCASAELAYRIVLTLNPVYGPALYCLLNQSSYSRTIISLLYRLLN